MFIAVALMDRTYRNNQVLYIRFYFFKMKDIRLLIY